MLLIGFVQDMIAVPQGGAEWKALAAGLLATTVAECALCADPPDGSMIEEATRRALRSTDTTVIKLLREILILADDAALDPIEYCDELRAKLMAYGHRLHVDGRYASAVDVFTLLANQAGDDVELRLQALAQRAFSLRLLSRFDDAESTYELLKVVGVHSRSKTASLTADAGLGRVLMERGNLPAAETLFRSVVSRARRLKNGTAIGLGFIDLAQVAGIRRDPVGVIEYSHQALERVHEPYRRDRVLVNMAYAFREIGRASSARRLAGHVAENGLHLDQRAFGRIVLYHLAVDANEWGVAESQRGALASMKTPPVIEAEYHETVARHMATSGDAERALHALARMLSVAESHRLAELIHRADEAMADVREGKIPKLYEFRPVERIPKRKQRVIANAENALELLCVG